MLMSVLAFIIVIVIAMTPGTIALIVCSQLALKKVEGDAALGFGFLSLGLYLIAFLACFALFRNVGIG